MNIRLSTLNDKNNIISLWHEAFGDSEKDILFFLENRFVADNTLVIESEGELASMLFLLEGEMNIKNKDYPSYYLYAACTSKKFRGRGYMRELLGAARTLSESRGKKFICLMPGEKSLFDFYTEHGYKTCFNKKICVINSKNASAYAEKFVESDCNYESVRNKAFGCGNYFKWNNTAIEFAVKHNYLYGGYILKCRKGYCLYTVSGDKVTVKEFAFTDDFFDIAIAILFNITDADTIEVSLPSFYPVKSDNEITVASAMILPIDKEAEKIIDSEKSMYLGLTLD